VANSLLDFVMSVVRDPEVAAQYAANPAQAIADADLSGVTTADVDNLIPVVAESLPSTAPSAGADAVVDVFGDAGTNIWASGAATAAFDAFDDHLPVQGLDDTPAVVSDLVTRDDDILSTVIDAGDPGVPSLVTDDDAALAQDAPVIDDVPLVETTADWDHPDSALDTQADTPQSDPSGFDLFD
jgi:hypothetical protein